MIYMLWLQVIDCVAVMCTKVALTDGGTVWFLPTDMEKLHLKSYVKGGEELINEPTRVYIPIIDDNQYWFLVIIKTNSWTAEIYYDTATLTEDRRNCRTRLASTKVRPKLVALSL